MKKLKAEFYKTINEKKLDQLAQRHGFCKRKRKLTPRRFLEMLLLKTYDGNQQSLTDHVFELKKHRDINVKKQSLHSRFSPSAVAFIKDVLGHQLKVSKRFEDPSIFKPFSKVFIQDATKFSLPKQLRNEYPAYGNRATKGGCQIQFTYELKKQQVAQLELHPAKQSECDPSINNSWIEKNALVLRDLGYFTIKGFKEIIDKKAFFISRAKPRTVFYELNGKQLDLKKMMNKIKKHQMAYCEKELIMGRVKNKKLPVRAIFSIVPDEVREERLRKAAKNAKERNWKLTKEYKVWAGLNVFITNVSKKLISPQQIPLTYRLRWQVELIFKTWKSHYKIHRYKAINKQRFECYLYASLLLILLQLSIYAWLQHLVAKQKIWLSIHKYTKMISHLKEVFSHVILNGKRNFLNLIKAILLLGGETLYKEKKKGKIGYTDIINSYE